MKKSYFRPEIDAMAGYVPGEQPQDPELIKLNTNENPYPPSPPAAAAIKDMDPARLRLYPDPLCDKLRLAAAAIYGLNPENIIAVNGSDDLLTIAFRCFTGPTLPAACLSPSYSLYPVLAEMQGAPCIRIPLDENFLPPEDLLDRAAGANLLVIARPNAPIGNCLPLELMEKICGEFNGIVLIDEAYADFAADNCLALVREYRNVIIGRTFSKSYSMAGARLGFGLAAAEIIDGMMKVKDSYNVNMFTQLIGLAALSDQEYLTSVTAGIIATRTRLSAALAAGKFKVVPSSANFIFCSPPDGRGEEYFRYLRRNRILVRYFPGPATGRFVRISIGTEAQTDRLLAVTAALYPGVG